MLMDMFAGMSLDLVLEAWDTDEELPKLRLEFADYKKQCKLFAWLTSCPNDRP
jgi:hypothetical protein